MRATPATFETHGSMLNPSSGLTSSSTSCACYLSRSLLVPRAPTRLSLSLSAFSRSAAARLCCIPPSASCVSRVLSSPETRLYSHVLPRYDIPAERSAGIDPKKIVRHVYVTQKTISRAEHGMVMASFLCSILSRKISLCASRSFLVGPVAFVLATLFEDFKKKRQAWVDSV